MSHPTPARDAAGPTADLDAPAGPGGGRLVFRAGVFDADDLRLDDYCRVIETSVGEIVAT